MDEVLVNTLKRYFTNYLNILDFYIISTLSLFLQQIKIVAIALCLHILLGNEAQGGAVDAVAQAARRSRTVIEYMPEMCTAVRCRNLGTHHTVRAVLVLGDEHMVNRTRERRPTAP